MPKIHLFYVLYSIDTTFWNSCISWTCHQRIQKHYKKVMNFAEQKGIIIFDLENNLGWYCYSDNALEINSFLLPL